MAKLTMEKAKVTIEAIKKGLRTKEAWVHRAVRVLADHASPSVIDRRKLHEYRNELLAQGTIGNIENARELCLMYAFALLDIATKPRYDFKGKTIVLTGKLIHFTRNKLTEELEGHGAFVTSAVSRNTDIVIVGSKPGSKFRKAQIFGVPMWTESELLDNLKPSSEK